MKLATVDSCSRTARLLTAACAFAFLTLTACGGDGSDTASTLVDSPPVDVTSTATISGSPTSSVVAGQQYSFQPTASGPAGSTLAFTAENLPAWASLNAQSGALSGTPTAADVGTYSNIVVSVSDGQTSAALPAFSIAVTQIGSGTATLSWTAPTLNVNGTSLTNLAGYNIHYGTSTSAMTQTAQIASPGLTTYVVENLGSGTWYFAIAAYTSAGGESALSNISTKIIP